MNHESTITEVFWGNVNRLMSQKGMNIYSLAESCGLARRSLERSRQRNEQALLGSLLARYLSKKSSD